MAKSINLYQDNFNKKSKIRSVDVALYSTLAVLALVVGSYFLIKSLNFAKQGQIESTKEEVQRLTEEVDEASLKEVNDQYLRFEAIDVSKNDAQVMLSHLSFLEQSLVPEVVLQSYSYSDEQEGAMSIVIVSDFLDGVAKQLTAFGDMSDRVATEVVSMTLAEEAFEAEILVTFQ